MARASDKYGKKIDTLQIRGKVRVHEIDLRFERSRMTFNAQFNDVWYSSTDARDLEKQLNEAAVNFDQLKFSWVIQYDMDVTVGKMSVRGASFTHIGTSRHEEEDIDLALKKKSWAGDKILGMKFNFHVVEVSDLVDSSEYNPRLIRYVKEDKDGKLEAVGALERITQWDMNQTLPYTPERYEKFKHISEKLQLLYRGLREVLYGDANKVAALIDSMPKTKLLLGSADSE